MKRYRLLLLFVFLVIFLIAGRAEALDVAVDGETVSRQAELVEGSAYIPLRELLDALGGVGPHPGPGQPHHHSGRGPVPDSRIAGHRTDCVATGFHRFFL